MALFLTISEGRAGRPTQPILASSDPKLIAAVLGAIERRMARAPAAVPLRLVGSRRPALREGDEAPR